MALKNNTWKLNQWYDQSVAGNAAYSAFSSGEFWTWGNNENGELGQNNTTEYSSPKQVPGTTWVDIIGPSREVAISGGLKSDGTLWMWGDNGGGRLGQNNQVKYSSPVQIPGTTWKVNTDEEKGLNNRKYFLAGQSGSTYAIKTDGTLWAWGYNSFGALGQNQAPGSSNSVFSSPVQIPGTTWKYVHFGRDGGWFGIKTDGTMWTTGRGQYGRLGMIDTVNYSSPAQIPGTTWSTVGGCAQHVFATRTDGTLWGWGNNNQGQLGANIVVGSGNSSPVQVPGTNWSTFETSGSATVAIKTDGTLWSWGLNEAGALGLNQTQGPSTKYSSPVQIGSGTDWLNVSNVGENAFQAVKTDGTLWSWGANDTGRLGHNNNTYYSSPKQIPGTSWNGKLSGHNKGGMAIKTS